MLTFGLMTLNLAHEDSYFTEIAKRAQDLGVICHRFVPSHINPLTEEIEGEIFSSEKGQWQKDIFSIPTILYDRCFYGEDFHSKQCKSIVKWLKMKREVQFLGYGLPNKWKIYEALAHTALAPYIPKTVAAQSPEIVRSYLHKWNKIILKPINGSQGNGIYVIEKQAKKWIVKTDKKAGQVMKVFEEELPFQQWLEKICSKKEFILQPFLNLTTEKHEPFDIRSLLQKNKKGEWRRIGTGIRIGQKDGIISNLSAGGNVLSYESWLEQVEPSYRKFITEEMDDLLTTLPLVMEKEFPPLFELGIDIGMAKDYSLWILDINSKPGRKVLLKNDPKLKDFLYESPLLYARHIVEKEISHL